MYKIHVLPVGAAVGTVGTVGAVGTVGGLAVVGAVGGACGTKLPKIFKIEFFRTSGFDWPGFEMAKFKTSQSASAAWQTKGLCRQQSAIANNTNIFWHILVALFKLSDSELNSC